MVNVAIDFAAVALWMQSWQKNLVEQFEHIDAKQRFIADTWEHSSGGGGISCLLRDGDVWEQVGVNYSNISGTSLPPSALAQQSISFAVEAFNATGVSVVAHPVNPHVPTVHANFRFFNATGKKAQQYWWFGGGYDLTPCYAYEEDCYDWHHRLQETCAPFGKALYPQFKDRCDEYFYLPHRQETRGVGGIFFDQLNDLGFKVSFDLVQALADNFAPAYFAIVEKRRHQDFSNQQRDFQLYRRGRYVEFNLLWDRGTRFGIDSGGRTESILMSLPPYARWQYGWQAEAGSAEDRLTKYFLKPRDWLNDKVS